MHVMTVLGPIDAERMGFTQPHEHVLIDHFNMRLNYEAILEDVGLATEEVQAYADAGGRTSQERAPREIGAKALGVHGQLFITV